MRAINLSGLFACVCDRRRDAQRTAVNDYCAIVYIHVGIFVRQDAIKAPHRVDLQSLQNTRRPYVAQFPMTVISFPFNRLFMSLGNSAYFKVYIYK